MTLAILGLLSCAPSQGPTERFVERLRARTPELLSEHGIPGAAFAVVNADGLVFSQGFGTRAKDGADAVDAETLFSIGSITKVFLANAVLMAVEDGSLDLDRPLARYLPEFQIQTRFAPHPEQRITLRRLLGHRAGIGVSAPVGNFLDSLSAPIKAHVASLADTWMRHPVGEYYDYSNPGFEIAGRVLETATGDELHAFVQKRIFAPLEMHRSQLSPAGVESAANRATGHGAEAPYPIFLPLASAGGIYSSANDMARYVTMRLHRGALRSGRLVGEALLHIQETIQDPISLAQTGGYGLGLGIHKLTCARGNYAVYGHNGGGAGFQASAHWAPELGLGYVVLQNSQGSDVLHDEFNDAFVAALKAIAEDGPPGRAARPLPDVECVDATPEELGRFEGVYAGRTRNLVLVNQSEGLHLYPGAKRLCLISETDAVVVGKGLADGYRFRFSSDGSPRSIVGLNSGKSYHYNDGPGDPLGVLPLDVGEKFGAYALTILGRQRAHIVLRQQRGYVYVDDERFTPAEIPGVFFSGAGRVLDLRPPRPSWRVIPLTPIERTLDAAEKAELLEATRSFADQMGEGSLDAALAELRPDLRTAEVGRAVEAAWQQLITWFGSYAGSPRAEIWALAEGARVDRWARFGARDVLLRFELGSDQKIHLVRIGPRATWWASVPAEIR